VAVELDGVIVAHAGVTRRLPGLSSDRRDESLAVAVAAVLRCDREEEDVAVRARGGEADERVAVEEAVDRRAPVGVGEEAPALLQEAFLAPDAFFQFPGALEVL